LVQLTRSHFDEEGNFGAELCPAVGLRVVNINSVKNLPVLLDSSELDDLVVKSAQIHTHQGLRHVLHSLPLVGSDVVSFTRRQEQTIFSASKHINTAIQIHSRKLISNFIHLCNVFYN
jgi:hypothetical protein